MENNRNKIEPIIIGITLLMWTWLIAYYLNTTMNYRETLFAHQNTNDQESAGASDNGTTQGTIYIVFLGIDRTDERDKWLGIYRTDVISLAKVDFDNNKIKLLSIPRDTYTYVPIEGKSDKLNHAYAFGSLQSKEAGVTASIEAIHELVGKKIVNYYFLMDMEPIRLVVDDIGGIELDVEIDMKTHGANLAKGLQVLNGQQAYDYIHWRYSERGDIDRIKRIQKFMKTLLRQQRDSGKIIETAQIILKYNQNIKTDLSAKQIIGLAYFMSNIPDGNVSSSYIPGSDQMMNGISYWVIDKTNINQVLDGFFSP